MNTLPQNRKRCSPGSKRSPKGSRTCVRNANYAVPVDNYTPNLPFAPASWIPTKKSRKKSSKKRACKHGRRHLNKCPTKSQSNALKLKVAKALQKRYRDRIAKSPTGPLIYDPDED